MEALVRAYVSMFDFYFAVRDILESDGYITALRHNRERVSDAVASFATYTNELSTIIGIETYGKVEQTDRLVREQRGKKLNSSLRYLTLTLPSDGSSWQQSQSGDGLAPRRAR